jgi:hypothetical protein
MLALRIYMTFIGVLVVMLLPKGNIYFTDERLTAGESINRRRGKGQFPFSKRRCASRLNARRELVSASCAPGSLSAAVAHVWR